MADDISFFTARPARGGDSLVPTPLATSMWSDTQLHGVAVSGALARHAERFVRSDDGVARTDLRAARWSVDLFKPVRTQPCTFTAEVVRQSGRLCLVDVRLLQDGEVATRAAALFLKPTDVEPAPAWTPDVEAVPPSLDVAPAGDDPNVPFVRSDAPWSQSFGDHQNAGRKATWNRIVPIVPGERPSGFVAAAATADGTSLVVNWSAEGVQHINTDVTMMLAREPMGADVGLMATERVEHDGIAVGTAVMFDREGAFGTTSVTALSNARRGIDFARVEYTDDGTRTVAS